MSDLIKLFRRYAAECRDMKQSAEAWTLAADELEANDKRIEELEAENRGLKMALNEIRNRRGKSAQKNLYEFYPSGRCRVHGDIDCLFCK